MKLYWSPTSPFVRKVRVLIKERDLEDRIEFRESSPLSREDRAQLPNPLGKIPCLVTDEGSVLYDSPVIMEFLDDVGGGPERLPATGPVRWTALRCQATADGMIDALVACFVESLRKPERQSAGFIAHNKAAALRCVPSFEADLEHLVERTDIGTVSAAVALAYLEQSFSDTGWRTAHSDLADWFSSFEQRPSMRETVLTEPG